MPRQAGNSANDTSLHQHQPLHLHPAKASPLGSSPVPRPATLATPAQAGQHCQQLKQCTPATAVPPFQQARSSVSLPVSPASLDTIHSTPEPRGAEPQLEEGATLPDDDAFGNASAVDVQPAKIDREPPEVCPEPCCIEDIVQSAVLHVRAWQDQYQKKIRGCEESYAARQLLDPQSAQMAALLSDVEAQQRLGLKHCPPRYCQFLQLRHYWYRLLGNQAVQLHQQATYLQLAALATMLVVEWIQNVQQTLSISLSAGNGGSRNQQADVHGSVLPEPTLSPPATAATGHASQAGTGCRHEDLATGAKVASADQEPDRDSQVGHAGRDPDPSAGGNIFNRGFPLTPALKTKQSVCSSAWQHKSPASDCGCDSCLAWETCKQPPTSAQTRDCRPYCSLPVGARLHQCCHEHCVSQSP